MKQMIFSLVIAFLFSGCSDFSHLRYRHVKKVPANPSVSPYSLHESKSKNRDTALQISSDSILPLQIYFPEELRKNEVVKYNKSDNKTGVQSGSETEKKLSSTSYRTVKIEKDRQRKKDGSILLVILLLFLGLGLVISGVALLIIGFYGIVWWMMVLGAISFLLGLLPFAGLFFGKRSTAKGVEGYQEKK